MVNIYIEGELLDQFDNENVEIISQVLDIEDISKVKGDYSKTFTVPASKKNNKVFKHWYNASIDSGFDARTKVDGSIDIDGIPFKKGKFLLRNAKIENGIITNYTINFFGNFTSFKDIIGKDKIKDLVEPSSGISYLNAYNFVKSGDNVRDKLLVDTSDLFPEIIFTPSHGDKYFYNSSFSIEGSSENAPTQQGIQYNNKNVNIAWGGLTQYNRPSNNAGGLRWSEMTASLRIDTIIDAIESRYTKANGYSGDIVFSRDFFDTSEFKRLYMFLSATPEVQSGTTNGQNNFNRINFTTQSAGSYLDLAADTFTDSSWSAGDSWSLKLVVRQEAEIQSYQTVRLFRGDDTLYGSYTGTAIYDTDGNGGDDYTDFEINVETLIFSSDEDDLSGWYWEVSAEAGGTLSFTFDYKKNGGTNYTADGIEGGSNAPGGTAPYVVSDHVPDIEVMEFLKGIFQMFKLVIVPQEDGTLYVNTIGSYYEQGSEYEISRYVDRSSLEVTRGEIISSIDLEFQPSETLIAKTFRDENDDRGYGDANIRFEDESGDLLEGDKLEIKLPFEQLQFDRLTDYNPDASVTQTNIATTSLVSYVGNDNEIETYEAVQIGCSLHYAIQQPNDSKPLLFRNETGDTSATPPWEQITDPIYMPSHHIDVNNPFASLMFEKEISNYTSITLNNTLYFDRINNYVQDIIDISRRSYKYTAKLPTIVSANLSLNDVLVIDGIRMRINKFTYNILTGLTELELWNSNYTTLIKTGNRLPNILHVSYLGDTFTFSLENADLYTITNVDIGFGTSWVATTTSSQNSRGSVTHDRLNIIVGANNSYDGIPRQMSIELTDVNGVVTTMIIAQEERLSQTDDMGSVVQQRLTGLNLLPASGNYIYDTTLVTKTFVGTGGDPDTVENVNVYNGDDTISDAEISLDRIQAEFPNLESLAVIVTWYGDTDNADMVIKPRLDIDAGTPVYNVDWEVGSYDRTNTPNVTLDGSGEPNQGGTPGDAGVLEFVAACNTRGIKVMLYPFLQMDTPNKGWRGLIPFASKTEVDTWWLQYEPFIRHYSQLFVTAGIALDKFMIGTELVTLTRYNDNDRYYGVQHLVQLAEDVRNDFGSSDPVVISYGANWDEYHSHDTNYHMDELWTSPNIDAVGIDNYFPATDFQDPSTVTLQNIIDGYESGEGWDHYYSVYSSDPATMLASKVDYAVAGGEFAWKNCFGWWDRDHTAHSYTAPGNPTLGSELLTSADFSSIAYPWNYGTWSYIPSPTVSGGIATLPISGGDYPAVNPRIEQTFVTISGETYTVEIDVNDAGGIPIQALAVDPNNGFSYLNGATGTFTTSGTITFDFTATSVGTTLQILVQGVDGDSVDLNSASAKQQVAGSPTTVTNTAWTARQKPLFFSEYGFASVDGTTNQPNVFSPDLPRLSSGATDNDIQLKGLIAFNEYWDNKTLGVTGFAEDRFAWAFDIRPYPQYPFGGIWNDSDDWEKGHWLNGKL